MQAFGGLAEASVGVGMTFVTGGVAAPLGWPVMAHGLDHFVTGMRAALSGKSSDSATSQLLQKTGMSRQTANLIDTGSSMVGTMGGAALIQGSRLVASYNFGLSHVPVTGRPATSSTSAYLLKNKLIAGEISGGHAFEKHVLSQGEFPGWIRTRTQFAQHIENVLNKPSGIKELRNGRTGYWHQGTGTIVIRNPSALDGGTAFQPIEGVNYFETRLR